MKVYRNFYLGLLCACAAAAIAGCAEVPGPTWEHTNKARLNGPDWANVSLDAMIDKYGPPDRIETGRVLWYRKGPWVRISVWDDMELRQFSTEMDNNIEETLDYKVPEDRRPDVKRFGARVGVSMLGDEISARSFSESRNFLALNLADEIVRGVKTPDEAKRFYARTTELADAGKESPYMKGLLFEAPSGSSSP